MCTINKVEASEVKKKILFFTFILFQNVVNVFVIAFFLMVWMITDDVFIIHFTTVNKPNVSSIQL